MSKESSVEKDTHSLVFIVTPTPNNLDAAHGMLLVANIGNGIVLHGQVVYDSWRQRFRKAPPKIVGVVGD